MRIGNFSGALGDWGGALAATVEAGVDVAIGDYLAEITMAMVASQLDADPQRLQRFYVKGFLDQMRPLLPDIARHGVKVVTNAGAFAPAELAQEVRAAIREAGLDLSVAHVEGDNLYPRLGALAGQLSHLDTGEAAAPQDFVAANAYLGGWGITAALAAGADIVVTGRVADASLMSGPAAWWHGWGVDDLDSLAGAVAAGHVIECGPQAVGGNFAGFAGPAGTEPDVRLGFPIAEIAADGSCVITKRPGDGGHVTVDTVTAQLMYEIQGSSYLTPDVVLELGSLRLAADGPDRVRISGARGAAAPTTTKVGCFYPDGYRTTMFAYATGLDIDAKVEWTRRQLDSVVTTLALDDYEFAALGQPRQDPDGAAEATVAVRLAAAAATPSPLRKLASGFASFGLGGIPGLYGEVTPLQVVRRIGYWPGLVRQQDLRHVAVLADGTERAAARPAVQPFAGQPETEQVGPFLQPCGDATVMAPLGCVVYARSGDKGGNANLGVWCPDPAAYPWAVGHLTCDRVAALLGVPPAVTVTRHLLPNLSGIAFVLFGYFGRSGSGNIRLDPIGKAVGELLRSRCAQIPAPLVRGSVT